MILPLFAKHNEITNADISRTIGLSQRMVRILCQGWVKDGWLIVANPANRSRTYRLSAVLRATLGGLS